MWPHGGGEVLGEAAACAVWLFCRPWVLAASIFSADLFFFPPSSYLNKEFSISIQFLNPSVSSDGTGTFQTRLANHGPEYQMSGFLVRGQGPV